MELRTPRFEQYGDLVSKAAASGSQRIAQAHQGTVQASLAAQATERSNISQQGQVLSQKLNEFNQYLSQASKIGVGMYQEKARTEATDQAYLDIQSRENKIMQIEVSELSIDEKHKQINKLRVGLNDDLSSIYGEAYNNVVKADFANSTRIEVNMRADSISKASSSAEEFKQNWESYSSQDTGAPDTASAILKKRIYYQRGLQSYTRMLKSEQSDNQAIYNENAKLNKKILTNTYLNAVTTENDTIANDAAANYKAIIREEVANGKKTPEQAAFELEEFQEEGTFAKYQSDFDASTDKVKFYDEVIKFLDENKGTASPSKVNKFVSHMEGSLKNEYNQVRDRIEKSINDGYLPDEEDVTNIRQFSDYMTPKDMRKIDTGINAILENRVLEDLPITERKEMLPKTKDGDSIETIELNKAINDNFDKIQADADSDPISTLYTRQDINAVDLDMESQTIDKDLKERAIHTNQARKLYDNVEPKFFTKREEVALGQLFESNDAEGQIAVVDKLINLDAPNDVIKIALRQMDKKDKIVGAVNNLIKDGNRDTAVGLLKGRVLYKNKVFDGIRKDLKDEIFNSIQSAMLQNPAGVNDMLENVTSLYAYKMMNNAPDTDKDLQDIDDTTLERSIIEIIGEPGDRGYAPRNVQARHYNDWLDFISEDATIDDIPASLGLNIDDTKEYIEMSHPIRVNSAGDYKFLYRGQYLQNEDGSEYRLRYKRIR